MGRTPVAHHPAPEADALLEVSAESSRVLAAPPGVLRGVADLVVAAYDQGGQLKSNIP